LGNCQHQCCRSWTEPQSPLDSVSVRVGPLPFGKWLSSGDQPLQPKCCAWTLYNHLI
jgi:hypothetical protein